jgi:hypothetical protein
VGGFSTGKSFAANPFPKQPLIWGIASLGAKDSLMPIKWKPNPFEEDAKTRP